MLSLRTNRINDWKLWTYHKRTINENCYASKKAKKECYRPLNLNMIVNRTEIKGPFILKSFKVLDGISTAVHMINR